MSKIIGSEGSVVVKQRTLDNCPLYKETICEESRKFYLERFPAGVPEVPSRSENESVKYFWDSLCARYSEQRCSGCDCALTQWTSFRSAMATTRSSG